VKLQCINSSLDTMRQLYPEKFAPEARIFKQIRRGDTLFVGTGCGEPQYLVQALLNYVRCYLDAGGCPLCR
jgi:acyl-CoA hydrolase